MLQRERESCRMGGQCWTFALLNSPSPSHTGLHGELKTEQLCVLKDVVGIPASGVESGALQVNAWSTSACQAFCSLAILRQTKSAEALHLPKSEFKIFTFHYRPALHALAQCFAAHTRARGQTVQ